MSLAIVGVSLVIVIFYGIRISYRRGVRHGFDFCRTEYRLAYGRIVKMLDQYDVDLDAANARYGVPKGYRIPGSATRSDRIAKWASDLFKDADT